MYKKLFIFIIILFIFIVIGIFVFPKAPTNTATSEEESTKNTASQEKTEANIQHHEKPVDKLQSKVPLEWQDSGIFKDYYEQTYEKLQTLTLDEKIGQLFLISYPSSNQVAILKQNQFGGYLFFEKDFKGKTETQVKTMIASLQKVSKIPILTAVDEEGGTVVRVSSNINLAKSKFLSPMDLYKKRRISRNRKRYPSKK